MRKYIVAGNWKMNLSFDDAEELIESLIDLKKGDELEGLLMIVCPSFPYLELATDFTDEVDIYIGSQNVSNKENGAYTGEVSASMLNSMDVAYCIVGHSERRKYFKETPEQIREKIDLLLEQAIKPIFCCGELVDERNENLHFLVVKAQIEQSLFHLNSEEIKNVVMAYEPVWAIGTGLTATPEQAEEMHAYIRKLISDKYGESIADEMSILYGGSCNANNARNLFAQPNIDGGLIGGASLNADDFYRIYKSF
ncbi:MAG: triose-phosphate isomerase [Bacteroidetes bacterium]|nr:triose-phosphate isomerase [Bacteroidota bacterium]